MRSWLVLGFLLLPLPSVAASFDCAKASAPLDHAICGNPGLSKLDEQMAFDIQRNTLIFGDGTREGGPVLADLAAAQLRWIDERNKCGAKVDCLTRAYEEQLAVLEFRARPGKESWADKVAGLYKYQDTGNLWLQVRDDNSIRLSISTLAAAGSARCNLQAIGNLDGKTLKAGLLQIALDGKMATIAPTEPNLKLNQENCPDGGSLLWRYTRR
jgi:uncharacterized protein